MNTIKYQGIDMTPQEAMTKAANDTDFEFRSILTQLVYAGYTVTFTPNAMRHVGGCDITITGPQDEATRTKEATE